MLKEKPYRHLNALISKKENSKLPFDDYLSSEEKLIKIELSKEHDIEGFLYVKEQQEKRPRWTDLADELAGTILNKISNKSSSAVLLFRLKERVVALTFGYGRFILKSSLFEQDFGLKTALNTLDHQSLRGVDLHTLEDQPIQKKSQASRESEASVFGIDIFKDILRSVTGSPRKDINYRNITGGDAMYSFGTELHAADLPSIAQELINFYEKDLYKAEFSWVDNVRKIKEPKEIESLDNSLILELKKAEPEITINIPEIMNWDSVEGFSFTRTKKDISPTIDKEKYFKNLDKKSLTIDSLKRDRVFVTDIDKEEKNYKVYSCIYFELNDEDTRHILFSGTWYQVENSFINIIDTALNEIEIADIQFPTIEFWYEGKKTKIETEGDYNIRTAKVLGYHLLDKKLVKCSKTTSPIELCDLLTPEKQFIHAKHKKGGSAGLSHLFAQGAVAAEVMLSDKSFRKAARNVIRKIDKNAANIIPIENLNSKNYEIVFLVLGDKSENVKEKLPFFSKVNLFRAYENLSQRGFTVKIAGAEKLLKAQP